MYNEELKTKFIRDYTQSINTANVATTIFNSFSLDEEGWQADLCTGHGAAYAKSVGGYEHSQGVRSVVYRQ